jgi:membrane protease YdiL (CAAX protease family)
LWSGHLLIFGKRPRSAYAADVGVRIVGTCLLVEALCRPFLRATFRRFDLSSNALSGLILVTIPLVLAIGLTRSWIQIPFRRIGLYGWHRWESTEKWFFPQIAVVALVAFVVSRWATLSRIARGPALTQTAIVVFAWQMIWGFYQEYVYRGLLQTELVRRWGTVTGILVSNLLFTFGPLHAYHFWLAMNNPSHLSIFAGIFAIGLYFGMLFQRSGNLWMIGLLHGLGDFFIDGLATIK